MTTTTQERRCTIDNIQKTYRVVSLDSYDVDESGEATNLIDESVLEGDELDLPYHCRIHDEEFPDWQAVVTHLDKHRPSAHLAEVKHGA